MEVSTSARKERFSAFIPSGAISLGSSTSRATVPLSSKQPRNVFRVPRRRQPTNGCIRMSDAPASSKALIFDCDGVIVESEELHRVSYNQCWEAENLGFEWSYEFYEMLQNSVGGGKEKMRWYFNRYGWPDGLPADATDATESREQFIAHLHKRKTLMYKELIENGNAKVRPGVLRLMDEAHERGLKTAVCSAANADAVALVLDRLVGKERLAKFDLILAGDVVKKKKPHPMIYELAKEKLNVRTEDCVVIEDSQIGLQAGVAAGLKVIITHTPYTATQEFSGAAEIYPSLGEVGHDASDDPIVTIDSLFPDLAPIAAV